MENDRPNLRKLVQYINDLPGDPHSNMMRFAALIELALPPRKGEEDHEAAQ